MDVMLINMPFGPLYSPSIGLSLLKATLQKQDINAEIRYFSLEYAKAIGHKLYTIISNGYPASHDLVGEWLFSSVLFAHSSQHDADYMEQVLLGCNKHHFKSLYGQPLPNEKFLAELEEAKKCIAPFIEDCVKEVLNKNPRIVGFTSVFQQQLPSLLLAKELKKQSPGLYIVFGGANNEGVMGLEYLKQFPFVDAVVSGEGEIVFPKLVQGYLQGEEMPSLAGIFYQKEKATYAYKIGGFNARSVSHMDDLPFVNYDDYFEQFAACCFDSSTKPRVLFESSRGCWWGEIMHCTFCGLNGESMRHRSKSAERVLEELRNLSSRYAGSHISVVDNILDMSYFKTLIPTLARRADERVELFYEVKANLKKEQVCLLRDAGITTIQPGIESLSDNVLKLMRKGVKAIQNIQLLKWCHEYDVTAEWNILWGFPGETFEDYDLMSKLVPMLTHLRPPHGAAPIRLDRFSPNFNTPDELGFKNISPYPSYTYVFPFQNDVLYNLAYFFTYEYKYVQPDRACIDALSLEIAEWKLTHEQSAFFSIDKGNVLLLWDFRKIARSTLLRLYGVERQIYLACDQAKTVSQLYQLVQEEYERISARDVEAIVTYFQEHKAMISDGTHLLSLAVPLGAYSPNHMVLEKLQRYIQSVGELSEDKEHTVIA